MNFISLIFVLSLYISSTTCVVFIFFYFWIRNLRFFNISFKFRCIRKCPITQICHSSRFIFIVFILRLCYINFQKNGVFPLVVAHRFSWREVILLHTKMCIPLPNRILDQ
eukprot:UN26002